MKYKLLFMYVRVVLSVALVVIGIAVTTGYIEPENPSITLPALGVMFLGIGVLNIIDSILDLQKNYLQKLHKLNTRLKIPRGLTLEKYIEHVNNLPADVQKIVHDNWDITGRPSHELSYKTSVCQLMDLCNNWPEFLVKYQLAFPDCVLEANWKEPINTMWHTYISGFKRGCDIAFADSMNEIRKGEGHASGN